MRKMKGIVGKVVEVTTRAPTLNRKRKLQLSCSSRPPRRQRRLDDATTPNSRNSECSSNGSSELVNDTLIRSSVDLENESTSSCSEYRKGREATPTSNLREESMERPTTVSRHIRSSDEKISSSPSEAEIEEFFSTAEKQEQRRFADKYNYDAAKDVPLKGRYEWVRLKP